jgi:hypothetical protein
MLYLGPMLFVLGTAIMFRFFFFSRADDFDKVLAGLAVFDEALTASIAGRHPGSARSTLNDLLDHAKAYTTDLSGGSVPTMLRDGSD